MEMTAELMRKRTKEFALRVFRLCRSLPRTNEGQIICKQLLRSGTSVAANYRAVCRARSGNEFYSKISIVLEEADESLFWLEFLQESGIFSASRLSSILKEANELVAIFAAARGTARQHRVRE